MLSSCVFAQDDNMLLKNLVVGNKDANVKVIEYISLSCEHCAAFFLKNQEIIKKELIDTQKINIEYKILTTDKPSYYATKFYSCLPIDKKEEGLKYLFISLPIWKNNTTIENLISIFPKNFITQETISCIIKNNDIDKKIEEDNKDINNFDIEGTPTFIINGKIVSGEITYDFFKKIITTSL